MLGHDNFVVIVSRSIHVKKDCRLKSKIKDGLKVVFILSCFVVRYLIDKEKNAVQILKSIANQKCYK